MTIIIIPDPCNDTDVQLVGGLDMYEGKIEICFNQTWGSVCRRSYSYATETLACRKLGLPYGMKLLKW